MNRRFLPFLILALASNKSPAETLSPKDVYKKYKPAVVKVEILQQGILISLGAGFFISPNGHLITNSHVLNSAFSSGFDAEFVLSDSTRVKGFTIAGCSDERGIDLCLIKLPIDSPTFLRPGTTTPEIGTEVLTIGHPRGYDFSISNGLVSGIRTDVVRVGDKDREGSIGQIQISAPISFGNSGGPVLDIAGNLIGVSTWIRVDTGSQNLNFAVSAKEISNYIASHKEFLTIKAYSEKNRTRLNAIGQKIHESYFRKAYAAIDAGLPIGSDLFAPFAVEDGGYRVEVMLMKEFLPPQAGGKYGKCRNIAKQSEIGLSCWGPSYFDFGEVILTLVRSKPGGLAAWTAKPLIPAPLSLTTSLMTGGQWEKHAAKLSSKQKKFLFSVPGKWKCKDRKEKGNSSLDGALECSVFIYNDPMPNASSTLTLIQEKGASHIIAIRGLGFDPDLTLPFFDTAMIAKFSARRMPASVQKTATEAPAKR